MFFLYLTLICRCFTNVTLFADFAKLYPILLQYSTQSIPAKRNYTPRSRNTQARNFIRAGQKQTK